MQELRDYQARAVANVRAKWASGVRRVMLVSPPGSGKTRMGEEIVLEPVPAVWFAHREELVADAALRLRASIGASDVGIIAPGHAPQPHARVQVISIQTAIRRKSLPAAQRFVVDEAHHLPADNWSQLLEHYPDAEMLLMTGTPCRQDGRALHGIADCMVVAIAYSQLVREGNLCEVKIFQPPKILQGIAQDPVEAWIRYADGGCGFAFFGSVDHAYECEHMFNDRGVRAAVIEQGTEKPARRQIIEALRSGDLDVICNVQTMTEGVDIPRARVCMLAAPIRHPGGFLQRTARVLRPHPSKQFAIIIDLPGATLLHGSPIEDREYSLDGTPIKRSNMTPLRQCPSCMAIIPSSFPACTECNFEFKPDTVQRSRPKIFSLELAEVWAGKDTPPDAKRVEYARLRGVQRETGRDLYYVLKSYKELFDEYPVITDATNSEKRDYLAKLYKTQKATGKAPKYVGVMFKRIFGHWPKGNGASVGA